MGLLLTSSFRGSLGRDKLRKRHLADRGQDHSSCALGGVVRLFGGMACKFGGFFMRDSRSDLNCGVEMHGFRGCEAFWGAWAGW